MRYQTEPRPSSQLENRVRRAGGVKYNENARGHNAFECKSREDGHVGLAATL